MQSTNEEQLTDVEPIIIDTLNREAVKLHVALLACTNFERYRHQCGPEQYITPTNRDDFKGNVQDELEVIYPFADQGEFQETYDIFFRAKEFYRNSVNRLRHEEILKAALMYEDKFFQHIMEDIPSSSTPYNQAIQVFLDPTTSLEYIDDFFLDVVYLKDLLEMKDDHERDVQLQGYNLFARGLARVRRAWNKVNIPTDVELTEDVLLNAYKQIGLLFLYYTKRMLLVDFTMAVRRLAMRKKLDKKIFDHIAKAAAERAVRTALGW